jgi:hypothetical protein
MLTSYEEKSIKDAMVELAEAEGVDLGMHSAADETLRTFAHSFELNRRALKSDYDFFTSDIDAAQDEFDGIIKQLDGVINRVDNLGVKVLSAMRWGQFQNLTEKEWLPAVSNYLVKKAQEDEAIKKLFEAMDIDPLDMTKEVVEMLGFKYTKPTPRQLLRDDLVKAKETLKEGFMAAEPLYQSAHPVKWQYPDEVVALMAFRRALRQLQHADNPIDFNIPAAIKTEHQVASKKLKKSRKWHTAIGKIFEVFHLSTSNLERNWIYAQEIESRGNQTRTSWSDAVLERDKARD